MRHSSFALAGLPSLGGLALGVALAFGPLAGETALAAAGDLLVVNAGGVNVRFEPSTDARVRQRVERNQQVTELQREGDWVRVEIADADRRDGWIHGSLLAPPGGEPLAAELGPRPAPDAVRPVARPVEVEPAGAVATATPAEPPQAPAPPEMRPAPVEDAAAAPADEAAATPSDDTGATPAGDTGATPAGDTAAAPADDTATAPGEVVTVAPETTTPAATPLKEALPAVARPAPAEAAIAQIEPAAAPVRDASAEIERFRQSVVYLNSRAVSVAGVDLFTEVEPTGGGVVQVAATNSWASIPPAGQESYANTLLDRWAAARGYGGPVSVQIVAPSGQVLLERSRP